MTTLSAQARVYTPGLFRHHGLSVAASYQKPVGEGYAPYTVLDILPRGCRNIHPYEYAAVSANYFFPIAYPDWGVSGIFFLKRIYASIGGDYAMAKDYFRYGMAERVIGRDHIWSYGGTLRLDIGFLRLPSQGTCTASFGVYVPSETGKPYLSVGFSIPL